MVPRMVSAIDRADETVKKRAIVYLIGIYFLIAPLEDIFRFDIGTLSKYVAALIIIFWLVQSSGRIFIRPGSKDLVLCTLALIGLAWISCFWSVSISTTISRNSAYTTLPFLFIIFGTMKYTEKEYYFIHLCISGSVLVVIAVIIINGGLTDLLGARLRLNARNDPNNLAALLLFPFGISMDLYLKKKKVIFLVATVVSGYFLLLTGSRGGLLACFVFCFIYMLKSGILKKPSRSFIALLIFSLLYIMIVKYLPNDIISRLFSREGYLYQLAYQNQTQTQRLSIWHITINKVIVKRPIFGSGSGTASLLLTPYYGFDEGVHNTYLNMVVEYGVLGILIFVPLLIKLVKRLSTNKRIVELALLIAIMIIIVFLDSYPKKFFWNVMYLGMISLHSGKRKFRLSIT